MSYNEPLKEIEKFESLSIFAGYGESLVTSIKQVFMEGSEGLTAGNFMVAMGMGGLPAAGLSLVQHVGGLSMDGSSFGTVHKMGKVFQTVGQAGEVLKEANDIMETGQDTFNFAAEQVERSVNKTRNVIHSLGHLNNMTQDGIKAMYNITQDGIKAMYNASAVGLNRAYIASVDTATRLYNSYDATKEANKKFYKNKLDLRAYDRCDNQVISVRTYDEDGAPYGLELRLRNDLVTFYGVIPSEDGTIKWTCGETKKEFNPIKRGYQVEGNTFADKKIDLSLLYDGQRVYWLISESKYDIGADGVKFYNGLGRKQIKNVANFLSFLTNNHLTTSEKKEVIAGAQKEKYAVGVNVTYLAELLENNDNTRLVYKGSTLFGSEDTSELKSLKDYGKIRRSITTKFLVALTAGVVARLTLGIEKNKEEEKSLRHRRNAMRDLYNATVQWNELQRIERDFSEKLFALDRLQHKEQDVIIIERLKSVTNQLKAQAKETSWEMIGKYAGSITGYMLTHTCSSLVNSEYWKTTVTPQDKKQDENRNKDEKQVGKPIPIREQRSVANVALEVNPTSNAVRIASKMIDHGCHMAVDNSDTVIRGVSKIGALTGRLLDLKLMERNAIAAYKNLQENLAYQGKVYAMSSATLSQCTKLSHAVHQFDVGSDNFKKETTIDIASQEWNYAGQIRVFGLKSFTVEKGKKQITIYQYKTPYVFNCERATHFLGDFFGKAKTVQIPITFPFEGEGKEKHFDPILGSVFKLWTRYSKTSSDDPIATLEFFVTRANYLVEPVKKDKNPSEAKEAKDSNDLDISNPKYDMETKINIQNLQQEYLKAYKTMNKKMEDRFKAGSDIIGYSAVATAAIAGFSMIKEIYNERFLSRSFTRMKDWFLHKKESKQNGLFHCPINVKLKIKDINGKARVLENLSETQTEFKVGQVKSHYVEFVCAEQVIPAYTRHKGNVNVHVARDRKQVHYIISPF
eukprot:Pgem_evm1s9138